MGYELRTYYRKNMVKARKNNVHQLIAILRTIESDFSLLTYRIIGFQSWLKIEILTYNLAYCLERFN